MMPELVTRRLKQISTRKIGIIIILFVVVVGGALLSFLTGPQTPELKIVNVDYFRYGENPPCIFVNGTVVNSSPATADNVTLAVSVYVQGVSPHGWRLVRTDLISLGRILGDSTRNFEAYVTYESIEGYVFAGIRYYFY